MEEYLKNKLLQKKNNRINIIINEIIEDFFKLENEFLDEDEKSIVFYFSNFFLINNQNKKSYKIDNQYIHNFQNKIIILYFFNKECISILLNSQDILNNNKKYTIHYSTDTLILVSIKIIMIISNLYNELFNEINDIYKKDSENLINNLYSRFIKFSKINSKTIIDIIKIKDDKLKKEEILILFNERKVNFLILINYYLVKENIIIDFENKFLKLCDFIEDINKNNSNKNILKKLNDNINIFL